MVWLFVAALAGVLGVLLKPHTVQGYVHGQPVNLVVASIGNDCVLRADAAVTWDAMKAACLAATGFTLQPAGPLSAFRTSEQQASLVNSKGRYGDGGVAAAVNMSPHQAGIAVDVLGCDPDDTDNYNPDLHAWLKSNCHAFCWHDAGDFFKTAPEPWHYEFRPELFSL